MNSSLIADEILALANADCLQQYQVMMYRPTVVGVVEDSNGMMLSVKSSKADNSWGFPQGGVKIQEEILTALLRELGEEVGILTNQVVVNSFLFCGRVDTPDRFRGGFTHGKQYYFFHVRYFGKADLVVNTDEIAEYTWLARSDIVERIQELDSLVRRKKQMMLDAISMLSSVT